MKTILLLVALILVACGQEPPRYVSISSNFSEDQRAVIEDALLAWCDETGWCPEIALWTDRGRIEAVPLIEMDAEDRANCPKGETCKVAGHNDGDNVQLATFAWEAGPVHAWRTVAHELGHYCTDHTKHGLMNPTHGYGEPTFEDASIDEDAREAWREGCGF